MNDGASTGMPDSSTANFIDEFRTALLKNSTRTLTSEAEALIQNTFKWDWNQPSPGELSINTHAPPPSAPSAQFSLLSPTKGFVSSACTELDPSELDLMVGENTLDWVSNLYNNLPSHELVDDGPVYDFTDVDFLGIGRVSISDNQEGEGMDTTVETGDNSKSSGWHCAQCGFIAGNRKQLWRHGKRENHVTRKCPKAATFVPRAKKERPDHKCDYCEYASKSRFNVVRHYHRVHINQKLTMCSFCSKQFKDLDTLKTHIRYTHENERKHSCELCEKQFVSSSDLQRHKRIVHEKIRDFVCEKCNKRFQTSTNAKRHFYEVCGRERNTCHMDVITEDANDRPFYVQF